MSLESSGKGKIPKAKCSPCTSPQGIFYLEEAAERTSDTFSIVRNTNIYISQDLPRRKDPITMMYWTDDTKTFITERRELDPMDLSSQ